MIKINLGSGQDYREGYVNVDDGSIFDLKRDVTADIFDYELPPESVDEILLSHVAMYIRPDEIEPLLLRWYGWLKVGGKIEIETIDIEKVMRIALDGYSSDEWGIVNLFGTKETCPHRWGWRQDKLIEKLTTAGFVSIIKLDGEKKPNRDYKLIATKK